MSTVIRLFEQPQAVAAGWTLVHFFWEGALIAVLAGALKLTLPRHAARLRYAVHCGALLLMVVAAVATYCVSFEGSLPSSGSALSGLGAGVPARILVPGPAAASIMYTILPWVTAFWLLGVLTLSIRWAGGWWLLRRKLKAGREAAPPEWIALLASLRQRLMVSRPVALEDTRSPWPQPALAATGGALKTRIERLLRPRGSSHAAAPAYCLRERTLPG
jgi:hypothetical protein